VRARLTTHLPARLRTLAPLAVVLALGAGLGVLVGGGGRPAGVVTGTVPSPGGAQARARDPVAAQLARMSVPRKVAQVFLVGFPGSGAGSGPAGGFRKRDVGGVVLERSNYIGPAALRALNGRLRTATRRAHRVRPWVMAAQEGGEFNALPGLPPATAPADLSSPAAGGRESVAAGRALRRLGVDGVLAPSLDVGEAENPAVGARAFSPDPGQVARYGQAAVAAYRDTRVFSAPGHFPGLGSGSQPVEQGPSNVGQSGAQLAAQDLVPFRTAIKEGAPGLVISNGLYAYDDFVTPASLSHAVMTGLLRRRLHFRGVALTDDLTDPAVTALETPAQSSVQALRAGADMLYLSRPPGAQEAAYRAVLAAVRKGRITRARLDQAVGRVLAVKRDYGLLR
jgi:beta-N-acetylhexosaminidase